MAKIEKNLKKAVKRVNKTKDQVESEIKFNQKIAHLKEVVAQMYPTIADVDTVYDAQTVVNALSGFIEALITQKMSEVKLSDLTIDLSKEDDSRVKTAIEKLIVLMKDEPASELSETLERFGKALSQYSAHTFMKQPMSTISMKDILA